MGSVEGKLLFCDACEERVFLKFLSYNHNQHDGGFGSYAIYEKPPEGWGCAPFLCKGVRDLCPNCSKVLNELENKRQEEEKKNDKKYEKEMESAIQRLKRGENKCADP